MPRDTKGHVLRGTWDWISKRSHSFFKPEAGSWLVHLVLGHSFFRITMRLEVCS